jgi:protein-S-isoprenylcysteine O-methyltransferase Ste14
VTLAALVKTLIFIILVPGTVTVLVPYFLLRNQAPGGPSLHSPLGYLGLVIMALGASVSLWCAWDFAIKGHGTPAPIDPPKELLVGGLYRYVRNPMYLGVLLILWGEALVFGSPTLLFYSLILLAAFHLFVLLYEEPTLTNKFGEPYRRYCREVPRWLPKLSRPDPAAPH